MSGPKIRNMEEFAAAAGISRPTVSKYFHDPDSVRLKTRERIEEALAKHDYRPNIFAVNQNRRLTKNIGLVVPLLADPYFAEMARFLEQGLIAAGFSPMLYSAHGSPEQEVEILDYLRQMKPAGVLIAPLGRRSSDRAQIERFCRDVPTILFDSNLEGIGEAFVGSDNSSFVKLGLDYMLGQGRAPAFLEMRHPANPNAVRRRDAYHAEMEARGLEPVTIALEGRGWGFEEIARQGMTDLIDRKALPASDIMCSNDRLAIGVLSACYDRGLRIGKGEGSALRVAGLDDHPFSRFTCPALTTVAHDYASVSNTTVSMLLDLVEAGGRFSTRTETLFPAHLVQRASA